MPQGIVHGRSIGIDVGSEVILLFLIPLRLILFDENYPLIIRSAFQRVY